MARVIEREVIDDDTDVVEDRAVDRAPAGSNAGRSIGIILLIIVILLLLFWWRPFGGSNNGANINVQTPNPTTNTPAQNSNPGQ